jgi:serralysin
VLVIGRLAMGQSWTIPGFSTKSEPGTPHRPLEGPCSGGITINLLFDAAAMAAPASFKAGIQQAAAILASTISDHITVNLKIDYSGTGGGAAAGPDSGQFESYTVIKADLVNNATPGDTIFNALPSGSSVQGQSNVAVWNAQLKLLGFLGANDTTTDDGSATFSTDINPNLLVGVALHELTHALGRVPYGPQPDIFDLFRFTSSGVRLFQGGATAPAAYFSVDGGVTKLADFGKTSDSSDFLNSGVQGPNDPFNEFYTGSTSQVLSSVDKTMLDALGFHVTAPVTTTVIEALGSTSLVAVGNNYFLYANGTSTGPELKYNGAPVVTAEFTASGGGTWALIGGEQTAGGYEVAWKVAGVDQYTVWNLDSNGNYLSNSVLPTSGSNLALENIETSFHQDLNSDGVIGVPAGGGTVIEALGSTKVVQVGNNYFLDPVAGGAGPELSYHGAAVTAGQFSPYTLIGAEQVAGGAYDVAWKDPGSGLYIIWSLDSSGNYVTHLVAGSTGTGVLESYETVFHQDLNSDGVIGVPGAAGTATEVAGSTALVQVGNNYFLNAIGGGAGPELSYHGAAVTAGQFAPYTPIGAEQVAGGGYDVAWKDPGSGLYIIWSLDSSGNYVTHLVAGVLGNDTTLESYETVFHQDLNGDHVIGIPSPQSLGVAPQASNLQALTVAAVNNDSFVFGAGATSGGGGNVDTNGHFGSPAIAADQFTALFADMQAARSQASFQPAGDGHDAVVDPGHHDAAAIGLHLTDPHFGGFVIG